MTFQESSSMATLYGAIWDPQDDYHRISNDENARETAPIEEQYHFISELTATVS